MGDIKISSIVRAMIIIWAAIFTARYVSHLNGSISLGEFLDGMSGPTLGTVGVIMLLKCPRLVAALIVACSIIIIFN